jgi:sugar/nucleoside kinase (ribokinase family)
MTPSLVLLGNLLVDDVVLEDGRTRMGQAGGAILYASLAAARWGASVGCVSLLGDDYPPTALAALRERGVCLDGVHALHGNGVRTWLLYEGGVRRVLHRLGRPSHEAVSPEPAHVPEAWRRARAFHLAPMPLATQRALVEAIRDWETPGSPAFVSLDPHVPVAPQSLDAWRELLWRVDAFFPSDDEMRWPEGSVTTQTALEGLAVGSLRHVAWKRGASGGKLYDARERRWYEWEPARAVDAARSGPAADPTGAGDAFAAGFVTARLEGASVEACLERAAATAALAVGAPGPDGLLAATRVAVGVRRKP